jgi:hypothetical protein
MPQFAPSVEANTILGTNSIVHDPKEQRTLCDSMSFDVTAVSEFQHAMRAKNNEYLRSQKKVLKRVSSKRKITSRGTAFH